MHACVILFDSNKQIDEPGVNTGTILAYQTGIPPRGRTAGEGSNEIVAQIASDSTNSTISTNLTTNGSNDSSPARKVIEPDILLKTAKKKKLESKVSKEDAVVTTIKPENSTTKSNNDESPKKVPKKREILTTLLSRKKFYKILKDKLEKYERFVQFLCSMDILVDPFSFPS